MNIKFQVKKNQHQKRPARFFFGVLGASLLGEYHSNPPTINGGKKIIPSPWAPPPFERRSSGAGGIFFAETTHGFSMTFSLSMQVCPKKGISPTILFWGSDLDHQILGFFESSHGS